MKQMKQFASRLTWLDQPFNPVLQVPHWRPKVRDTLVNPQDIHKFTRPHTLRAPDTVAERIREDLTSLGTLKYILTETIKKAEMNSMDQTDRTTSLK